MLPKDDFLQMGTVGRPHGIKGEIGVFWDGDFVPPPNTPIFLQIPGDGQKEFKVLSSREHKGQILFALDGVNDRNAAEALKGAKVSVSRHALPELEPDEAYLKDLVGCSIFLENNDLLGVLDHFEFPAGQEIWVITDKDGQEILFPARQEFIDSIDVATKRVVINPPPGLVEIYCA